MTDHGWDWGNGEAEEAPWPDPMQVMLVSIAVLIAGLLVLYLGFYLLTQNYAWGILPVIIGAVGTVIGGFGFVAQLLHPPR